MQSFLQYKRYEKAVRAQYDRDRTKFEEKFTQRPARDQRNQPARLDRDLGQALKQIESPEKEEPTLPRHGDANAGQTDSTAAADVDAEKQLEGGNEGEETEEGDSSLSDTGSSSDDDDEEHSSYHDNRVTLSRTVTQQSQGIDMSRIMTGIQVRRRTTREGGAGHVFVVDFEGPNDPLNPHNWSFLTRWGATINIACIGWIVGFASSVDSGALEEAAAEFGVSDVVEACATGLFLIGFGAGALIAGPMSEEFGRNPVYIGTMAVYCIFIMASALAPNIGAQLAFRFLAGWFGATPLACAGGSISDLWDSTERVFTFPLFANAAFMGPIIGPVVGGFIGQSNVSWRWCEWVTLIASGAILTSVVLFQPETYPPVLLKWRAAHLREITGDDRFRAAVEIRKESFPSRLRRALYRPFLLLVREPIVMLFGLYLTVIYIILFTFLNGYTFIFSDTYGFSQGITGLCFIGIAVGLCLASPLVYPIYRKYKKGLAKAESEGKSGLAPEQRLLFAMCGAPAIPISMFWMGWTAYPTVSFWSPLIASVVCGYGILCIFISCYQYLIDSYAVFAASALASVTVIRYMAAGGMVIVAIPMYENLGVHWSLTVLGCISALITPVPYLFYFYGHKIRQYSKFAQGGSVGKSNKPT